VDVTGEGLSPSKIVNYGSLLFAAGLIVGVFVPFLVSTRRHPVKDSPHTICIDSKSLNVYIISFGIGMHNLGEDLELGASYAVVHLAFTTLLVVGFALHNGTEGLPSQVQSHIFRLV
jgi:hypothetical protein